MKARNQVSNILTTPMFWMLILQDGSSQKYQELHLLLDMDTLLFWPVVELLFSEEKVLNQFLEICML